MITMETSRDPINPLWKKESTAAKELKPLLPQLINECSKVLRNHFIEAPKNASKLMKEVYQISNDGTMKSPAFSTELSDKYSKMSDKDLDVLKKMAVYQDVRALRKLVLLDNYLNKLGDKEITNGKLSKEKAVTKVAETFYFLNIRHSKQRTAFVEIFTEKLHLTFYDSDYAGKEKKPSISFLEDKSTFGRLILITHH